MNYLLSIIVPTKDRYKYLKHLILLIKGFNLKEIELVIHDNTKDNAEILAFIKNLSYPHLKYYHHSEKIPIDQNATKALLKSTGEFVCYIGDDDGVTRNIVEWAKWMKYNKIEALRSRKPYLYLWPDAVINSNNKRSSVLVYHNSNETCEYLNPIEELNIVCKIGMQNIGLMPKLYHGVVRRDILDKIYRVGGRYFPGAAGDMANAVALSFFVEKFVVVDFPVTIHGSSQMLGGGIVRRKNEIAELSEVNFITQEVRDNWEKRIPRLWHTFFVWPESGTKALRYMSKEEYISKINYDYMLAHFLSIRNSSFFNMCLPYSKNKNKLIKYYLKFKSAKTLVKIKKLVSYMFFWDRRLIYSVKLEENIENIVCAEKKLFERTGVINFDALKKAGN
jgi:glycosyltransferase involved in cell wall biosynthesis